MQAVGCRAGWPETCRAASSSPRAAGCKPFGQRILHSEFWRFTRRSVPRGVAMGLFVGVFFLIPGVQIIGAALFCLPVRGNIPIAAGMTFLTNPFTTPFLILASIPVGNLLGFHADGGVDHGHVHARRAGRRMAGLARLRRGAGDGLGLFIIAVASGAIGYLVSILSGAGGPAASGAARAPGRARPIDPAIGALLYARSHTPLTQDSPRCASSPRRHSPSSSAAAIVYAAGTCRHAPRPPPPAAASRRSAPSASTLAGMDRNVAPGDNFYHFANGNWDRTTEIPADRSNYGMFTVLADLSRTRTRDDPRRGERATRARGSAISTRASWTRPRSTPPASRRCGRCWPRSRRSPTAPTGPPRRAACSARA